MKTDLNEQLDNLKLKYDCKVQDKSVWEGKPVNDFFSENRGIISELLKEYPKFKYKDVQMLAGLTEGEMPFEKELIQTKLLTSILDEDNAILLPRYAHRILNDTFSIKLNDGSLADCVIFLPKKEQYIEFKICHHNTIGGYINKCNQNIDMFFVVIDDWNIDNKIRFKENLNKRINKWNIGKAEKIILCDMNGDGIWEGKKEASQDLPLFDSPMATSERVPGLGLRTDEITSPTVSIVYLQELKNVNRALNIHYPSYFMEQGKSFLVDKPEYLFLFGGNLKQIECRNEYKTVKNDLIKQGKRVILPKDLLGPKENRLWLKLATAVVEFDSKTGTQLCSMGAAVFAKNLGVEKISIEQLLPGFSFVKEMKSEEPVFHIKRKI